MDEWPPVRVLRIGHRPGRDERTTTHVGLTARALGADGVVLAGPAASQAETIVSVTDRFGGPFAVETTDDPVGYLGDWTGEIVHLTMYGLLVHEQIGTLRERYRGTTADDGDGDGDGDTDTSGRPMLVVVGAAKVPFDIYERADWNLAVTNQPHSEIAALAVFLDRLYQGAELDREFADADRTVIPQATGKRVEDT